MGKKDTSKKKKKKKKSRQQEEYVPRIIEYPNEKESAEDEALSLAGDMPAEDVMADLAELFKIFGDSTRIRILFVLFDRRIHVNGIAKLLNMTQSAVSHQLRILKQAKLVAARREGKSMIYYLADDHVRTIIAQGLDHVTE